MLKRTQVASLVLFADAEHLSWVQCTGSGERPQIVAFRVLPRTIETASAENARFIAEEAMAALPEGMKRSAHVALPSTWVEHLIVTSPALRGLDRVAHLLREVTKRTALPSDDVAFADCGSSDEGTKPVSRLVLAAREQPILAFVDALRARGMQVRSVTSGPACVFARELGRARASATGETNESLEVLFHLRRSGFAICLHSGGEIHQVRVVAVELPDAIEPLAESIAEEIRRSTVSARDKHWNRGVGQVRIMGRCTGDSSSLATTVEVLTGLATLAVDSADAESDSYVEAAAIHALARARPSALDLLPRDFSSKRTGRWRVGLASALSCAALAGILGVSHALDVDTQRTEATLDAGAEAARATEAALSDYGTYLSRLDAVESARDALKTLAANRLDVAEIVSALAASIGPDCQIESIRGSSPVGGSLSIRIDGRFVGSYWPYETNLSRLVGDLRRRSGLPFASIADDSLEFTAEYEDFVLESRGAEADEPSHP